MSKPNFFEKNYAIDVDLCREGVHLKLDSDGNYVVTRYAGDSNPDYQKALMKVRGPHAKKLRKSNDSELNLLLTKQVFAEYVIIEWGGPGMPKYSKETVLKTFEDYKEFFFDIVNFATDISNFRPVDENDVVENLGKS